MSNSQDGGHGTSNPDQPTGKYSTRSGAANQDGTDFEIKMCALVFLRAVQSYSSFTMRSNYGPAGDLTFGITFVYQTFSRKEYPRVLFTDISQPPQSQDMLFTLWSEDVCDVLVITDVTNCSENLGENIVNYEGNPGKGNKKKIVIISNRDTKTLGISQLLVDEFGTEFLRSTFNQLDDQSKDLLKNLPVDFQGKEIILGKIMAAKILEGGRLQYVLTSPKIQIGKALPSCDGIYITRILSKRIIVNNSILNSNDIFFFCGIEEYDLKLLIAQAKGEKKLDEKWFREQKHRFNIKRYKNPHKAISRFYCRAKLLSEDPVHFFKVIDNSLLWMHTHGNKDNIFKYIETYPREEDDCKKLIRDGTSWAKEEDLVTKEYQTVIVAGEPGSGKTALLREVAIKTKKLHPHRWIINIDLNKHSNYLEKMKHPGNVTSENILELLNKAAHLDDSELGKQLLKYHVAESGDVCILFDAFDEIAPLYIDTVLDILQLILSDFRLSTFWVASRYNVEERIEIRLQSNAFRIEPLSRHKQFNFVSKFLGEKKAKEFQTRILDKLPIVGGVRLSSFPLHLRMICEICHDVESGDILRMSSSITNLYEQFIEKNLYIYFKEKVGLNLASASIQSIKERERDHFLKSHMICSLVVVDLLYLVDEPHRSSIEKEIQKICQDIEEGKEKFGILDCVVDGKPHFIHRTFAEYFAGKWFAKHWKGNKTVIRDIAVGSRLEILYVAFCTELASELRADVADGGENYSADELREIRKRRRHKRVMKDAFEIVKSLRSLTRVEEARQVDVGELLKSVQF